MDVRSTVMHTKTSLCQLYCGDYEPLLCFVFYLPFPPTNFYETLAKHVILGIVLMTRIKGFNKKLLLFIQHFKVPVQDFFALSIVYLATIS